MFRKIIKNEYSEIVKRKETAEYFRSLVLYKYAYRGWVTVSRCKHLLNESKRFDEIINSESNHKRVRILNSGIGTFALLYALVNKHSEIYAFENSSSDYKIAETTANIPTNLHYIHAVWNSELDSAENFDFTIILDSDGKNMSTNNTIYLPLKS